MRLQLRRLRQCDASARGGAAEALRAGRQGDGAHAQGARGGNGQGRRAGATRSCRTGAPRRFRRRIRTFARQSGRGEIPVAPPPQQGRLRKDHLARRVRSQRRRSRLCRRRLLRRLRQERSGLVDQIIAALGASHATRRRRQDAARGDDRTTFRWARRPTICSSCSPTSPAASGAPRRARSRRARTPTATPRRSTCWRRCTNSPARGPHPEAFVEALDPLQPRLYSISSSPKATPGRVSLTVDTVRYRVGQRERLGVASTFLGRAHRAGRRRARPMCRRRTVSRLPRRSEDADHHDRPRHRRRAVPRLPAGAQALGAPRRNWLFFGHQRAPARFLLRGRIRRDAASRAA